MSLDFPCHRKLCTGVGWYLVAPVLALGFDLWEQLVCLFAGCSSDWWDFSKAIVTLLLSVTLLG